MNKENSSLKLVDEIILYYDARSKKHQKNEEGCDTHTDVWRYLWFKINTASLDHSFWHVS